MNSMNFKITQPSHLVLVLIYWRETTVQVDKTDFRKTKSLYSCISKLPAILPPTESGTTCEIVHISKYVLTTRTSARCLKITVKVSFNIACEASYVYILFEWKKLINKTKKAFSLRPRYVF